MDERVKPKTGLLNLLPFNKSLAHAIYPNIYFPDWAYHLYQENPDDLKIRAIIEHEGAHLDRQRETGPFKWWLKYLFNPRFRYQEELVAIKSQKAYLQRNRSNLEPEDVSELAGSLSSWEYLKMISYEKALDDINNL